MTQAWPGNPIASAVVFDGGEENSNNDPAGLRQSVTDPSIDFTIQCTNGSSEPAMFSATLYKLVSGTYQALTSGSIELNPGGNEYLPLLLAMTDPVETYKIVYGGAPVGGSPDTAAIVLTAVQSSQDAGVPGEDHWWTNWSATHGFVSSRIFYPQSVREISDAVATFDGKADSPVRAVGGGWSFSDAALPFSTQAQVDAASVEVLGATATENLHNPPIIQDVFTEQTPMDLTSEKVDEVLNAATQYNQETTTDEVNLFGAGASQVQALADTPGFWPASGPDLYTFFATRSADLIDIRGLAASLQQQLPDILSPKARSAVKSSKKHYFHVEAGITMADLDQLLDHQSPRLALQSSGGSPGATLAGTLSTATHGGEFRSPLLVDTVRAIHLVGPGGQQWWIEGAISIADRRLLRQVYPKLDSSHFIGGARRPDGLTAQDVLNAVIVSMGTMGVIYSVVLEAVPQYGIRQKVKATSWNDILEAAQGGKSAGDTQAALRSNDPQANLAILELLLDGAVNGTGIARGDNIYADLAMNPFTQDCWITNRQVTPVLPLDSNTPAPDYLSAISASLGQRTTNSVNGSLALGRVFDFFGWTTDLTNPFDLGNDVTEAAALAGFVGRWPDIISAGLATINVQAVANENYQHLSPADRANRGHLFLADLLTGFLNALQGTSQDKVKVSDRTGVSYKVGAIGWPDGGIPGRGLEISLAPTVAFSFLQNELLDDILVNTMLTGIHPLLGYISIRICPATATLFGMQQFSPYSVMIEIVGYRSPESKALMDQIQQRLLELNRKGLGAMLHWGLENDQMSADDLLNTPLNSPIRAGSAITKIEAFSMVRKFFLGQSTVQPFDNNFTRRLGL
jgi:hypothetical protein